MLASAADPLARALGPGNEVVIHDLALIPNSIVAIAGNLTGRSVGGPTTDLLLRHLRRGQTEHLLRYRSTTPSGAPLISSTIFLKDASGSPTACLCINTDLSPWSQAQALLNSFTAISTPGDPEAARPPALGADSDETFPITVEALTVATVDRVIREIGVQVPLMHKQHKLEAVRRLESLGVFLIRDAVDYVARALDVTRYTIYNYLSDLRPEARPGGGSSRRATMKRLPLRTPAGDNSTNGAAPPPPEELVR